MRKYDVQTLSKALYSLDVHAHDINLAKNKALDNGEKDLKDYFLDLKFCYNLKYLSMQKMVMEKHLIFQDMEVVTYDNGNQYLFSLYRNKVGMPFRHPATETDTKAILHSYKIDYPDYFEDTNTLEPFYSLKKSSKILLDYIERSADAVKYMNINIFNDSNMKKA